MRAFILSLLLTLMPMAAMADQVFPHPGTVKTNAREASCAKHRQALEDVKNSILYEMSKNNYDFTLAIPNEIVSDFEATLGIELIAVGWDYRLDPYTVGWTSLHIYG